MIDEVFNFLADDEGLSMIDITEELEAEGINVTTLGEKVKKILKKHAVINGERGKEAP